jgi:membrane protein
MGVGEHDIGKNADNTARLGRRLLWLLAAGAGVVAVGAARRVLHVPAPEPQKPVVSPWRAVKAILWRLIDRIYADRILSVAAGATFYGLLALFPAITAMVSLYGLVADAGTVVQHVSALSGLLPTAGVELISEQITRIASKGAGTLGAAFFTSLAISLWSAMAGVKGVFEALNVAEGKAEQRSFIEINLLALAFTLGSILFVILAISAIVVVPVVLEYVSAGRSNEQWLKAMRWPVLLTVVVAFIALLYRYGPCRSGFRWRWVTLGSLVAGLLWLGASALFSFYVTNLASYNETYGSLGAVMAFMTWMWLSISIIILGALLNAELTVMVPRLEQFALLSARTAKDGVK